MKLINEYFDLLNSTLGLSVLLVTLVIIRDFAAHVFNKDLKLQVPLAFLSLSILIFSIKALYKYGPFNDAFNPMIAELLETVYLLFTFAAVFLLLRVKELSYPKI